MHISRLELTFGHLRVSLCILWERETEPIAAQQVTPKHSRLKEE